MKRTFFLLGILCLVVLTGIFWKLYQLGFWEEADNGTTRVRFSKIQAQSEPAENSWPHEVLPAHRAFPLRIQTLGDGSLQLHIDILDRHYLYQSSLSLQIFTPSDQTSTPTAFPLKQWLPSGEKVDDPWLGAKVILRRGFSIPIQSLLDWIELKGGSTGDEEAGLEPAEHDIAKGNTGQKRLDLVYQWQGCAEHIICYPPSHAIYAIIGGNEEPAQLKMLYTAPGPYSHQGE